MDQGWISAASSAPLRLPGAAGHIGQHTRLPAQATGGMVNRAAMADGDLRGGALMIVVVPARRHLAGADTGAFDSLVSMVRRRPKGVAAGVDAIARRDRHGGHW